MQTLEFTFLEERIGELLAAKLQEKAFQDCFLVELILYAGNKLVVYVDGDQGVTIDKCQQISRFLEAHLDDNKWLGVSYSLEVSSPGLDKPLKLWRQYRKNIGRKAAITLTNGEVRSGLLQAVHEGYIVLEEQRSLKEGKKKSIVAVQTELPFEQIEKTMIAAAF